MTKAIHDDEALLAALLAGSRLNSLFEPKPEESTAPPLPLTLGQIALRVAAGQLRGLVRPAGGEPHVIRGTTSKVMVKRESDDPDKSIAAESIRPKLRALYKTGEIKEYE